MSHMRSQDWDPTSAVQALLDCTTGIDPIAQRPPTSAVYPASGFTTLPLHITFPSQSVAHQP